MHYSDKLRFKFDVESQTITLSIRINEDVVLSRKVPVSEFWIAIAQLKAQIDEVESGPN